MRESMKQIYWNASLVIVVAVAVVCGGRALLGVDDCESSPNGDEVKEESPQFTLCTSIWHESEYTFVISADALDERSKWQDSDSPKCSPKSARTTAIEWLRAKISPDIDGFAWKCVALHLLTKGSNKWYWVVDCQFAQTVGGSSGIPIIFSVGILADGSVVEPRIDKVSSPYSVFGGRN